MGRLLSAFHCENHRRLWVSCGRQPSRFAEHFAAMFRVARADGYTLTLSQEKEPNERH